MGAKARGWRDVAVYFALVMGLTVPFWIAAILVPVSPMPGLSISAFAVVVPTIGAVIAAGTMGGRTGVAALFASLGRPGRNVVVVLLLSIAVPLLAAAASWSLAANTRFAGPADLFALIPIFLVAAVVEEIGWSAFATERLAGRVGVVAAGLAIGVVWALWHWPSLVELGHPADWIAWWSVWTVAQRVIMARLYVHGGAWIWGPVVFHVASNVAWQAAIDAFDPLVEGVAMAIIAVAVTLVFGSRN